MLSEDITLSNNEVIYTVNNKRISKFNFDFKIEEIEEMLKNNRYNGEGLPKDDSVEKARLAMIAPVFYKSILENKILTPEELYNQYKISYFTSPEPGIVEYVKTQKRYEEKYLHGRVIRTYPSILRDFMFFLMCQKSNIFDRVVYSLSVDIEGGYDLLITYKDKVFGVSLFTDTDRSWYFRELKKGRRDEKCHTIRALKRKYPNLIELEVPLNPEDKQKNVGNYWLYKEKHFDEMIKKMECYTNDFKNE